MNQNTKIYLRNNRTIKKNYHPKKPTKTPSFYKITENRKSPLAEFGVILVYSKICNSIVPKMHRKKQKRGLNVFLEGFSEVKTLKNSRYFYFSWGDFRFLCVLVARSLFITFPGGWLFDGGIFCRKRFVYIYFNLIERFSNFYNFRGRWVVPPAGVNIVGGTGMGDVVYKKTLQILLNFCRRWITETLFYIVLEGKLVFPCFWKIESFLAELFQKWTQIKCTVGGFIYFDKQGFFGGEGLKNILDFFFNLSGRFPIFLC